MCSDHERLQLFAGVVVSSLVADVRSNGGTQFTVDLGLLLATRVPRRRFLTHLLVLDQDSVDIHYILVAEPDTCSREDVSRPQLSDNKTLAQWCNVRECFMIRHGTQLKPRTKK